ncbi:hypothetical protein FDP41_007754 [Naegleria fowleri]|uniref:Uncharacterized protein n=1 Tax=Naegleria fowleri TaxID=5763 RepID=A0A6A5CEU1_NAEFO|nr:uncharacterized protein FDP41_007754 [Naegleria fowleri]KAF0983839.1 hypothetical protein FDP41_007754 [Naegleria fowleri]CAG4714667.1 unnamed protein product [Naegleria fowleri]
MKSSTKRPHMARNNKNSHSTLAILVILSVLLSSMFVFVYMASEVSAASKPNLKRTKRVKYYNDREIYDDIVNADRDEFVDDIPIEKDDSDDEDNIEYENFIACGSGNQRVVDKIDSDSYGGDDSTSSPQQASRLLFNPFIYYKNLLHQDLQNTRYYGEQLHKRQLRQLQPQGQTPSEDPQLAANYNDIAKKYANNLANHAKYLYKYRSFAPAAYRKYIVNVYEYSKRVVEVAKVQNWNGYLYYLNVVVEYYRKIEVLEQVGYGMNGQYVQSTPVATYNAALGSPQYYGTGIPPAGGASTTVGAVGGAVPYGAVPPAAASYYPYASSPYYGMARQPPTPYYGGYPTAYYGYGYPNSYYYYPQQPQAYTYPSVAMMNTPMVATTGGTYKSDPNVVVGVGEGGGGGGGGQNSTAGSSSSSSSSNTTTASNNPNSGQAVAAPSSSDVEEKRSSTAATTTTTRKLKRSTTEEMSSHEGTFGDDVVPSEPFTFELLI